MTRACLISLDSRLVDAEERSFLNLENSSSCCYKMDFRSFEGVLMLLNELISSRCEFKWKTFTGEPCFSSYYQSEFQRRWIEFSSFFISWFEVELRSVWRSMLVISMEMDEKGGSISQEIWSGFVSRGISRGSMRIS